MSEKRKRKGRPTPAQLRLYIRLSDRGRLQGCPRDEELWRRILEVTSGKGIRPERRPTGYRGVAEFLDAVPPLLRNFERGLTVDLVAVLLRFDNEYDLYEALKDAAHCRQARQYGRRKDEPVDEYEDSGEPYHPGEEDEWPDGIAKPDDSSEVPF